MTDTSTERSDSGIPGPGAATSSLQPEGLYLSDSHQAEGLVSVADEPAPDQPGAAVGWQFLKEEHPPRFLDCRCRKPVPPGQMLRWSLAVQPRGDCVGVG
jgi:hypothetical protein